jgi:hypothetical protein
MSLQPPKASKQGNRFSQSENVSLEKTLFFENNKVLIFK